MKTYSGEHMALRDVKNGLSAVVEQIVSHHERVVITRNGKPAVVMVSVEDLEGLEETLDILSDPEETRAVLEGIAEDQRGETVRMTKEEFLADVKAGRERSL